jgi:hypothetical protein
MATPWSRADGRGSDRRQLPGSPYGEDAAADFGRTGLRRRARAHHGDVPSARTPPGFGEHRADQPVLRDGGVARRTGPVTDGVPAVTLGTTLSPCWYCSGPVHQFGISRVVIGESA